LSDRKQQRLDIVGCGAVIQAFHVPALLQLLARGVVSVAGCFDTNVKAAESTARIFGAKRWGSSPDGDLQNTDSVLLATPPEFHAQIAETCIRSGKHVFIEKPLVVRREEAERLVQLAEANNVKLFVNHFRRLFSGVAIGKRFLSSGGLGRVRRVEASEGGRWGWEAASDYVVKSPYGGVLFDTGSHVLDTMLYLVGLDEIDSRVKFDLTSVSASSPAEPSHECFAEFVLTNASSQQIPVNLKLSRRDPLASVVKVFGESGVLVLPKMAESPILRTSKGDFILTERSLEPRPTSEVPAFIRAHEQFLETRVGRAPRSPLDAKNVVFLTGLLEALINRRNGLDHG
jgi:predicted dehydrogenase